jgi:hypothetical protein
LSPPQTRHHRLPLPRCIHCCCCCVVDNGLSQCPREHRRCCRPGGQLHVQCAGSAGQLAADSEYHAKRGPLLHQSPLPNAHQFQAQVYEAEGNDPQTYLLLYRHADLVLQKLQTHPDRNQPQNRKALNAATTTVYSDLKKLESIAPRIKKRHAEYQERRRKQQDALKALEGKGTRNLPLELDGLSIQDRKRTSYDSRPTLDAQENHSLATRLAQREVRRRDTARRSVRQHGVSEEEEQHRRTGGRWESWQEDLAHDDGRGDLMSQLQEVARLQQNGQKAYNGTHESYSSVRLYQLVSRRLTNNRSNLPLDTLTRTTTPLYLTNPGREVCPIRIPSSVTPTQHQHGLPKNRSTDRQELPQYHHLCHQNHQQHHWTPQTNTQDHHQYQESMQKPNPRCLRFLAKSWKTALQRPQPNSMISPSSRLPTLRMVTLFAQSSCLPSCVSSSSMWHLRTRASTSKRVGCFAAS